MRKNDPQKWFHFLVGFFKNALAILVNLIPPQKYLETLRTGQFSIVFPPYMMTTISKKQNFVILCGRDMFTLFLPEYTLFQFCPDIHFLNENDIEK